MEWIKKNLGWIGFAIFLLGTCIAGIAKFFYDKDWSLLGMTALFISGTLWWINDLLNKTPKAEPWKIYTIIIISSLAVAVFTWVFIITL